ncbi:transmembrane protein 51b [Lampris incognitus]|uniref:transmembrane protein 51b n=1 Tax=Lampris incognitus TaxID=2546036 RepID=UPI0024B606AE|nr:transmembrane protein 51b [Lampris incognitus]XP_056131170.1 transmembrane protein 51b [Lampris incognitus]
MCSSRGLCRGGDRPPNRSSVSGGSSSGSHYALCALAVGLIALGIVMIVWTEIPLDGEESGKLAIQTGNSTMTPDNEDDEESKDDTKTSSVAFVLVGVGVVMLLLAICLGMRNKRRAQNRGAQPAAVPYMDHVAGEQETAEDPTTYTVPSYDEVISTGQYPVRESNLQHSTSQLPSYEDIIAAVEADGAEPNNNPSANPTPAAADPAPSAASPALAAAEPHDDTSPTNQPTRSSSRASRILRPLRVRRIKSDKLHLKDFRLHIRSPTQNPVTIEPITPPPQYDDKMPELG